MSAPRTGLVPWLVLGALAASPEPAAAQRDSASRRLLLRAQAGALNEDDPLDFEFAAGAEVGADFNERLGIVLRVVGQGRVDNPGRAGETPDTRIVTAMGIEYSPRARQRFGEQFRVRFSVGLMMRDTMATAPVLAPGFLIRYRLRAAPLVLLFTMEDMLAFLPNEPRPGARDLDAKIEHNFLVLLGLEFRL